MLAEPAIRRLLFGFLGFSIGEQAGWIAMLLVAYQRGGVAEAGFAASGLLAGAIFFAPFLAVIPDKYPNRPVIAWGLGAIAFFLALSATAIFLDWGPVAFYIAGAFASTIQSFARPAVISHLPRIAKTPDQLTAANVAAGFAETTGQLIGPALVGLVLIFRPVEYVLAAAALASLLGALISISGSRQMPDAESSDDDETLNTLQLLREGFSQLRREPRALRLVSIVGIVAVLAGAIDVSLAAIAVELLGKEDTAVGILATAFGFGAIVGSALTLVLIGRRRLSLAVVGTTIAATGSLALLGRSGSTSLTVLLLVALGAGISMTLVGCQTMIQGLASHDTMARMFGVVESLEMTGLALGGIALSTLVAVTDLATALVVLGLASTALVLMQWPALARIDANRQPTDPALLNLFRSISIFAPLPAYSLEQVLSNTKAEAFAAGTTVIEIGDEGDCMYIVAGGTAMVILCDGTRFERGVGTYMGEIAIMKSIPRTAGIEAGPDGLETYSVSRSIFLEAITGVPRSLTRAEAEIQRRLR